MYPGRTYRPSKRRPRTVGRMVQRFRYSSRQATVAGAIVSAGMAVGRPIVGYYGDRLGERTPSQSQQHSRASSVYAWTTAENYAAFVALSFLSGCVLGTYWAVWVIKHVVHALVWHAQTLPTLLNDSVAIQNLPSALATTWLCVVIPGTSE